MNRKDSMAKVIKSVVQKAKPPPKLTISQWADQERRLSTESSAESGRWNTNRAPYQRGIMDAVNDNSVETVVIKASSQVGKTEVILNFIGYFIHHDPAPMLVVLSQLELAQAFSKDRLAPMIRDTPALKSLISDGKTKRNGDTILHKVFPGGHITLAGANSPSSLASRPVRFVLCDEVDRFPRSAGEEGDPVNLAKKRTKTFTHNRKIVLISTPTIKRISRIDAAYENSDQRKFFVPCPHCGEYQTLKWSQVKWENNNFETTVYLCESCDAIIDESAKMSMLRYGEWRAEKPFFGTAGFFINELYSPWSTWKEIVKEFLEMKNDAEQLKTWINTTLGESWEQKGDAPEWRKLYDRRENYEINKVPKDGLFLTCGVDVQKNRIEAEIVAWGRDKQSWSIDYRVIPFDTSDEKIFKEKLEELLNERWEHESGVVLPIKIMAVDSGYRTQTVYSVVRKYPKSRVIAIKGQDSCQSIIGKPSAVDVTSQGKTMRRGLLLWPVGSSKAKEELYGWLESDKPTDEELHLAGGHYPFGYCHFPEYGDEFFKMLTAEQLILKTIKGKSFFEWKKVQDRNEALDIRVYNRAAASVFGIDRFKEAHWLQLESTLGSADKSVAKIQPGDQPPTKPVKPPPRKRRESSIW